MREQKYTRRGKSITQHWHINRFFERVVKDSVTVYDFINEAKRRSRELQMDEDGALGPGSVRRGK